MVKQAVNASVVAEEMQIKNEKEMKSLAKRVCKKLKPGTVIALKGTLGAGKTVFVKGIAEGLGIDEPILSPTFTLVQHYEGGTIPLYHLDLYRLGDREEFELIDGRAIISSQSIICIEWYDIVSEYLKASPTVYVDIEINEDNTRNVEIRGDIEL